MAVFLGCGNGNSGSADATPDGPTADAPDTPCDAGETESQGSWEDWDSGNPSFLGIFDATISEGAKSAQTAPNGRAILCLGSGDHLLSFEHPDYLSMTAAIAEENLNQVYSARGLKPARLAELFTQISLSVDVQAAQLLIELPAGATANIDAANDGMFELPSTSYVFYANVSSAGPVNLTIVPPSGESCMAVATLQVSAGVISFTSVSCS